MELPDSLFTIYSAEIERREGEAVLSVPERELDVGDLAVGSRYRVAILPTQSGSGSSGSGSRGPSPARQSTSQPPVEEGDRREVEIEDIGDQGDGIARIGPGYIVFVPGTEYGDRVTVEIQEARENFAFAEVVEGEPVTG